MENIDIVDYSRQEALNNTLTRKLPFNVQNIIIGCGGIGYWLGLFLALLGYKNFILIDGDKIDYTNLNRIPVPQTWVGVNKAVALRRTIRTFRLDTKILTLSTHITEETMDIIDELIAKTKEYEYSIERQNKHTIWDTTDNALIQQKIWKKSQQNKKYIYRKLGYEAFDIGCYSNMDIWTADDYTTGYRTTNANAITSAISAGMGIFSRCLTDKDVSLNLKDLILSKESA